jgi:hypothetical protein
MSGHHFKFLMVGIFISALCSMQTVKTSAIARGIVKSPADTLKKDPESGLFLDTNLYMVKAQCTSCHSSKLIMANRFTRDGWRQKIRWMQAKHNLWELGDTEKQVLDYLEKYYSPTEATVRRAPLKNIQWYKLEQ